MAGRAGASLQDLLESAVVEVEDGKRRGTGFYIAGDLLLTCAHVAQSREIIVRNAAGVVSTAIVVDRRPETYSGGAWPIPDLAILRVDAHCDTHLVLDDPDTTFNGPLLVCGFAVGAQAMASLTYERPRVLSLDPVHGGRLAKLVDCTLAPGMSGSPVVRESDGRVVGVVKRTRAGTVWAGGWALPVGLFDTHLTEHARTVRGEADSKGLQQYLRTVIERNCTVEPRGMRRSMQTQDVVFPLDDIFVSLEMRDYSPADLETADADTAATATVAQDLAVRPYLALDVLRGQITVDDMDGSAAVRNGETPHVTLPSILGTERPTVLLGDPGSGKSTLLQWLALTFARAALRGDTAVEVSQRHLDPESGSDEMASLGATRVPVLVRAASYVEALAEAETGDRVPLTLIDFALRSTGPATLLRERFLEGRLLVLVDGLDEVPSVEGRRRVRDELASLWRESPGNILVITSRHAGYRQVPMLIDVDHRVLQPLHDAAVLSFLYTWSFAVQRWAIRISESDAQHVAAKAMIRAREIYDSLQKVPSLTALARTPLMLTVVSLVYEELGRLPRMRIELLQSMGRLLVERRPTQHTYLDAQDLLGPFALWLQQERPSGLATQEEFRSQVAQWTSRIGVASEGGRHGLAERFCATAQEQFGLIVERGQNLVGFQHRLFQEFFAAGEVVNTGVDLFFTDQRLLDPVWREVVLLTASLLGATSRSSVSALLKRLVRLQDVEVAGADRTYRPTILAADCLVEIERLLPDLAKEVVTPLIDIVVEPGLGRASLVSVARAKTKAMLPRYVHVIDSVVTALLNSRQAHRDGLCALVESLECDLPAFRTRLEIADGEGTSTMPERRALVALQRATSIPMVGEAAVPLRHPYGALEQQLIPYGNSRALYLLRELASDEGVEDSDTSQLVDVFLDELRGRRGAEASLLAVAAVFLAPGRVMDAYRQVVTEAGESAGADLLAWCLSQNAGRAEIVDAWSTIDSAQRYLLLQRAVRMRRRVGMVAEVAWRDLALQLALAPDDPGIGEPSQRLCLPLQILSVSLPVAVTEEHLKQLGHAAARGDDARILVERVLAGSPRPSGHFDGNVPDGTLPFVQLWADICDAEADKWRPGLLGALLAGAHVRNGLWHRRVDRVLARRRTVAAVPDEVLAEGLALMETTSDDRTGTWAPSAGFLTMKFLSSLVVSERHQVESIIAQHGPEAWHVFVADSNGHRHLWALALAGDNPAAEALLMVARHVPVARPDDIEVADLNARLAALGEVGMRLSGHFLAQAALGGEAPASQTIQHLLEEGPDTVARLQEFVLVACTPNGPAPVPRLERDRIAVSLAGSRADGSLAGEVFASAIIGLSLSDDDVPDLAATGEQYGLTTDELVQGLLMLSANPSPWFGTAATGAAVGLSRLLRLVDSWGRQPQFAFQLLTRIVPVLQEETKLRRSGSTDYGEDWPRLRFAAKAMLSIARTSPDAFVSISSAYQLPELLEGLLSYASSFTVRVQLFQLLCYYCVLTAPMVDSLRHLVFSDRLITQQAFAELRLIRQVTVEALESLASLLADGGRPAVAALDLAGHLSRCAVFAGDEELRFSLWLMLVQQGSRISPFAECELITGAKINERQLFGDIQYEVGTLQVWRSSDSRWLTLTELTAGRPRTMTPRPKESVHREDSFQDVFMRRARKLLMKGADSGA